MRIKGQNVLVILLDKSLIMSDLFQYKFG